MITVFSPSYPVITEISVESNEINIFWNNDDTVDNYTIHYNVSIIYCTVDVVDKQNCHYVSPVTESESNNLVISGSIICNVTGMFEINSYSVSITAVNIAGKNTTKIINSTNQDIGMLL